MSRRVIVVLVAALMMLTMAVLGGSALALTDGQTNACAKHAENNGKSVAKGIDCAPPPPAPKAA